MSHEVIVVGGGEIGVEMGLHLAKHGHEVKLLEMGPILSPESVPVHFRSIFEKAFNNQPGFSYELNAKVTGHHGEWRQLFGFRRRGAHDPRRKRGAGCRHEGQTRGGHVLYGR